MVSVDISSDRLVPAPGADGWLCRVPGAVAWLPGQEGGELILACLAAASPSELLGRVGSHLADPEAEPWPAFAILAARGDDLVVVVHGPVEVTVDHEGSATRLFGGDDLGSWLNRVFREASAVRAGNVAGDEDLVDLREGVIRAGGFAIAIPGASPGSPADAADVAPDERAPDERAPHERAPHERAPHERAPHERAPHERAPDERAPDERIAEGPPAEAARPQAQLEAGSGSGPAAAGDAGAPPAGNAGAGAAGGPGAALGLSDADSPTVIEQAAVDSDATVAEGQASASAALGAASSAEAASGPRSPARLTWDNGEVHPLPGAVLIGRDVAGDEAVLAGQVVPMVPGGSNDSMSRVHAELRPRGRELVVTDRGSTNGTFVWDEGAKAWQRLVAGQPQVVPSGTVVAFGERTATFEGAVP